MSEHTPAQKPGKARRQRAADWILGRGGGPGGNGPGVRPLDIALIALGIASAVAAIAMMGSSGPRSIPASEQVAITSILAAADAGQLESVTVPSSRPASAVIATSITSGPLVVESGKPLKEGDIVRFYAPPSVQPVLLQRLADAGVPLFMGAATAASGASVRVGVPGSAAATGPYAAQQEARQAQAAESGQSELPDETAAEREAGGSPFAPFLLIAGIALCCVGGIRTVSYRMHRKALAAAKEPEGIASDVPSTRFADVAGADEAIEQMREMVEYLKDPDRFTALGARLPKGALLVGPPGTGKTLLARAVAGEAGVAFVAASGSDMVEKYVGVGARRVRDLFARARSHERAIVFIDEVDAVARRRSSSNESGASNEHDQTLVALLTEMDGFYGSKVIVLAATNRPDVLDPALTRPGRLDRRVEVPLPDRRGREAILGVHARSVTMDTLSDLNAVARRTPGFSGAQLEAVVNEAALEAVRRRLPAVSDDCLDAAVATVAMGRPRTSALVTDADRRITAWHEAGHAVSALLLADADPPVAVSIVPRGPAGGVTWMSGTDDQFLSRSKAHARLVVALGGRAAEQMLLDGEFTQGAAGDLQAATETALAMATQYGMTRLGLASRAQHLGGTTTKEVTEVVEELLAEAHSEATTLLTTHRRLVGAVAAALLEHEDLSAADLARIALEHGVVPASAATPMPSVPVPIRPTRTVERRAEPPAKAGKAGKAGKAPLSERLRRRRGTPTEAS